MTTNSRLAIVLTIFCSLAAGAQQTAPTKSSPARHSTPWKVQPEWVHADEDFLASDALEGRGSATRDEWIAATFVAAQFESFGLRPAAPDKSFIEPVELITPKLDGKAQLTAGETPLQQGPDFYLLTSSGESVTSKLLKIAMADVPKADVPPGWVVLLTGGAGDVRAVFQAAQQLGRSAGMVLVEDSPAMKQAYDRMLGGKTRVPTRIKGVDSESAMGRARTIGVLNSAAFAKVAQAENGTPVSLTVHVEPGPPTHTYNAMAVLEGSDPNAGALLLSAHLDHLGVRPSPNGGDSIYNGADDDAAGTTAVIELARALAAGPRPKRTIYFVCFGSEETGGQGDNYFRNHPPVPLDQFVANVEFEMIGAQDPKLPKGYLLLTGWERSDLGPTLKKHGARIAPDPYPEQHYFERSDNYALALKGVVAHTAAGWGNPPWYHRPDDELSHLDFEFMREVIQSFVEPIRWLANSNFRPQWKPGGMPKR